MSSPLLQLVNVTRQYQTAEGIEPIRVLDQISLEISPGESVAIIGPSGSGKSTLLNIIGTLDKPTSGEVLLDGDSLGKHSAEQLAEIRNRRIGFVFQSHHLLPQCSVLENVLIPTLAGRDKSSRTGAKNRAVQLLKRVGLDHRLAHLPGQLSGGERQRVAVVRALINRPKLLLADEPTGALDRHAAQQLTDLLTDLNREENVTLIVVTHALALADKMERRLELKDGRLVS